MARTTVSWMELPAAGSKPSWTQKGIVLRVRQRSRFADFVISAIDGFKRHRTSRNAALLAHYGFLSVFPLIIALTTVLGFVLQNNTHLRTTIVNSAMANVPIIGQTIGSDPSKLHGNIIVLIVGLATTLWAGTKAFVAAQNGMNDIWEIPDDERPKLAQSRLRALVGIAVVGVSQIASGIVSGLIGVSGLAVGLLALLVIVSIAINIAALMASYRVLTARRLTRAQLLPGAIGAGIVFSILQVVGGALVIRATKNAQSVYGTFASVIGLLTWLSFHSIVALLGVEANAALDRDRFDRSAFAAKTAPTR